MQVSQRSRTDTFSLGAAVGAILLLCAIAILAAAPAAHAEPASDKYIVVLKDDVAHPANVAHRHEDKRGAEISHIYGTAIEGYSAEIAPNELEAIEQDPAVDYVEPDGEMELDSEEPGNGMNRVFAVSNPNLDIDEVDDARMNVDIAILDDEVATHPDLNVFSRVNCALACGSGGPIGEHGTHVAGIAAAIDNNFGVVGTAPGARIWSVGIYSDDGSLAMSSVLAAVNYVTEHSAQIEVVNMSFHCTTNCTPTAFREAIAAGVNKGVVFVAAAGNEGKNVEAAPLTIPAAFPDVITVSNLVDSDGAPGGLGGNPSCYKWYDGVDKDDTLAGISNWGPAVDIAAPGTCIVSTVPGGGYFPNSGTSMAAPMVAGAVADMAAAKNPENRAEVEAIRNLVRSLGNYDWTDDSPDGVKEPLLDMRISSAPRQAMIGTTEVGEITTNSAKLSSLITPNGSGTNYYFQWGPTTAYGYTTPGGALGAGSSEAYAYNYINNLTPGTTYHFRPVATNAAGTVYGNDHSFTSHWGIQGQTPSSAIYREANDGLYMFYPKSSGELALEHNDSNAPGQWKLDSFGPTVKAAGRTASLQRANGDTLTFYRGTDNRLHYTSYSGAGWQSTGPVSLKEMVGSPSVIERNDGSVHAFHKGVEGSIWDYWFNPVKGEWGDQWIGGTPSGNVNAIYRPNADQIHVFYRDKITGGLWDLWINAGSTGWNNVQIPGAPVSDPKPMFRAGSATGGGGGGGFGDLHVFIKATDGALHDVWLSGSSWYDTKLGGKEGGVPAGNAAPIYRTVNGDLHAFYRGTSGNLYDWWMDAQTNEWHEALIGGPIAGSASPINDTLTGELHVFYTRPDGSLYDARIAGSSWNNELVTSGAAVPLATEEMDTDNDAILDSDDGCPNRSGPSSNYGCPVEIQQSSAGYYYPSLDSVNAFFAQTAGGLALKYNDYATSGTWKVKTFASTSVVGPISAIYRPNNDVLAFYRSSDSKIHSTWLNHLNSQWTPGPVTGLAAGPPSAIERSNGDMHVVFKSSTDGTVHDLWYDVDAPAPAWKEETIGGVPAGNPAVSARADTGDLHAFYRRTSGAVYDLILKGSTWSDTSLASVAPASANDPKPLYRPDADHSVSAFYKGTDGKLHDVWLSAGVWHDEPLGGTPAGDAAPIYATKTGNIHVFYRSTAGYLQDMWLNSQTNVWQDKQIGGAGLMKGTPAPVNRIKNGDLQVFYARSNGTLYDDVFNGTAWADGLLESGVAVPSN